MSTFHDTESAEYRQNQILQLEAFLDDELPVDEAGTDFADHVIVAGDLNDTFAGIHGSIDTLEPFEEDPAWIFATEDTLEYTQISHKSKIDHILLNEAIVGRYGERGQEDGCKVVAHDRISPWASYEGGWNGEQVVSDHRSVWIYVDVEWEEACMEGWTVGSLVRRGGAGWLAVVALVTGGVGGCRDKDPECQDLEGLTCAEAGIPAQHHAAICDDCRTLWFCAKTPGEEGTVLRQPTGCECIDDNGCLITSGQVKGVCSGGDGTYDDYDTGPPSEGECDSD